MEEFLYKIFEWIIDIDVLVLTCLLLGFVMLMTRWRRVGMRFFAFSIAVLFFTVILPFGQWSATTLENRFSKPTEIPDDVEGVIVLGGYVDRPLTVSRGQTAYNSAAGRFIESLILIKERPDLKVVFAGGGVPFPGSESEAELAKKDLKRLGVKTDHIIFEDRSRNTRENARFSYDRVRPDSKNRWLLVTSAMHMPRAVGLFRQAGWNVIAYPVDYQVPPYKSWRINFGLRKGITYWRQSTREWAAMISNYLFGYSRTLFPA